MSFTRFVVLGKPGPDAAVPARGTQHAPMAAASAAWYAANAEGDDQGATPRCGHEKRDETCACSRIGKTVRKKNTAFGRIFRWVLCIYNVLMLAWVVDISAYLSDADLDPDIAGADRFGRLLVLTLWIASDIAAVVLAWCVSLVRRGR